MKEALDIPEIKERLNDIPVFYGLNVSDFLGNALDIEFRIRKKKYSFVQRLLTKLKVVNLRIKSIPSFLQNGPIEDASIYLLSSPAPHFTAFLKPLLKQLPQLQVFCKKEGELIDVVPFLDGVDSKLTVEYRNFLKKDYPSIRTKVVEILNEYDGVSSTVLLFELQFHSCIRRFFSARNAWENKKPEYILTDFDRNTFNASMICAARSLGIPTFSMVHGSTIPPDNYIPVVADYLLVWGEFQKEQFVRFGHPAERIFISGNTRLNENPARVASEAVLNKLGLNKKRTVILINSNMNFDQRLNLVRDFLSAFNSSEINQLVKLHPREKKEEYSSHLSDEDLKCLLTSDSINIDEARSIADVFVVHNSVMALELLLEEQVVLLYDGIREDIGIGRVLHEEFGVPKALNPKSLQIMFQEIIKDSENNEIDQKLKEIAKRNCVAKGEAAALNIKRDIKAVLT